MSGLAEISLAIAALFTCTSCVTAQPKSPLIANANLIRSYTFDLEAKKHLEAPYVAKYEINGKLLLYVASEHISAQKYPNLYDHPTLKTIAALFAKYRPEVVIIEGIDTGEELSPKSILKKADECEKSDYRASCGESFFAINSARKNGAEYITGEPRNPWIKDEIVKAGYSVEDLLGFYLVRQIPQYKRQAELDRNKFSDQASKQLKRFQQQIGTNVLFGFKEFDAWYAKTMPSPKNYLDITNDDPAPHGGPKATHVQKISNKVSLIRDKAFVKTIERMLNKYSRVLVVYGGSHLITQEPALEAMLGGATYFRIDALTTAKAREH